MEVTFAVTDRIATFIATVPENATFLDLKLEIAKTFKKNYLKLFLNGVELDFNRKIKDYQDTNNLFIFTNASTYPSPSFIEQLRSCKTYKKFDPHPENNNTQPSSNAISPFFNPTGRPIFLDELLRSQMRPPPPPNQQRFVFTMGSSGHFFNEIDIQIQMNWSLEQCKQYIFDEVKKASQYDVSDKDLLLYTVGGIPFIGGTLATIYDQFPMEHLICGVFYNKLDKINLDYPIQEVCDISTAHRKQLISPLCESTSRGLSDMACILGYLRYGGMEDDLLIRATSTVITFPPFITSLYKIIDNSFIVTERDVITVCATFYNYFRSVLPENISDDYVLNYGLRLCNIICHIDRIPNFLPINVINNREDEKSNDIAELKLPSEFPVLEDRYLAYPHLNLTIKDEDIANDAYEVFTSFSPIYPESISFIHSCRIIKGKYHEFLYLKPSPTKAGLVQMIDPTKGKIFETTIEEFAQQQNMEKKIDEFSKFIDKEQIKQIIEICLDASSAMKCNMEGSHSTCQTVDKMTIANQFITFITQHLYSHRIPCLQGLISFGNDTVVRHPISPLDYDFDAKELNGISADGQNYLWDAVLTSIYHISKCLNGPNGGEYKHARPRIIVLTSGENCGSHANIEDVAKVLVENHIILDAIVLGDKVDCPFLCSMCHMTGGSMFMIKTIDDGIQFFEKCAFFDLDKRRLFSGPLFGTDRKYSVRRITPEMVNSEFLKKAAESANSDIDIVDSDLQFAKSNQQITTPRLVIESNHDKIYMKKHHRRLLKELQLAAEMMEKEHQDEPNRKIKYDPNIKVFINKGDMTIWRIFLKGPDNSPYENIWWYLIATFPESYPINPPTFRFISIPYHINISTDGMVCLDLTDAKYKPEIHPIDMIKGIRELLLHPNIEYPIRMVSFTDFTDNYQEYERNAKESAEKNAKKDYNEYLTDIYINDDVSEDFVLKFTKQLSQPLQYC